MTAENSIVCQCRACGQPCRVDKRWKLTPIATCSSCGKLFWLLSIHGQPAQPLTIARVSQ